MPELIHESEVCALKTIFLDFDGVIVLNGPYPPNGKPPDPACLKAFNRIADHAEGIIVTSNWRYSYSLPQLVQFGKVWGLGAPIVGATFASCSTRGEEVHAWLSMNPEVFNFVILDDDHQFGYLEDKRVRQDTAIGLTKEQADRAIEILNG
jgi:hypothetical protein